VSENELSRLVRDVEDVSTRLRKLEVYGTEITNSKLATIEDDVKEIKMDVKTLVNSKANVADLETMRKAQAASRSAVYAALVAAALSLAGSLILFAVVKASGG
jgi:hypothetical protein